MSKKPKIEQFELNVFYEAMKDVKPLAIDKKRYTVKKSLIHTKPIIRMQEEDPTFYLTEQMDLALVEREDYLSFHQVGISHKVLRKLRKGQYNIEAILDLHGLSVEEASAAVETFLKQCLRKGLKVVLIIHGKGHHGQAPILKNRLNHWLRNIKAVLAFCSAAPSHGNRGAVYILLKRDKEETIFD